MRTKLQNVIRILGWRRLEILAGASQCWVDQCGLHRVNGERTRSDGVSSNYGDGKPANEDKPAERTGKTNSVQ